MDGISRTPLNTRFLFLKTVLGKVFRIDRPAWLFYLASGDFLAWYGWSSYLLLALGSTYIGAGDRTGWGKPILTGRCEAASNDTFWREWRTSIPLVIGVGRWPSSWLVGIIA